MSNFRCEWLLHADQIDLSVWNKLMSNARHVRSWYASLDKNGSADDTQFHYGILYDRDVPVAIVPVFLKSFPIDFPLSDALSKLIVWIDAKLIKIRYKKVLFVGSYMDSGYVGLSENYPETLLYEKLAVEIEKKSRELKAHGVMWKDFEKHQCGLLARQGYFTTLSYPNTYINLNVKNFDDYLLSLSTKKRTKIRKFLKMPPKDSCEFFVLQDPNQEELNTLHELFSCIEDKYHTYRLNFEQVNKNYYDSSSSDQHFIYLGLRQKDTGQIINILQCMQNKDNFYLLFYGFDRNNFCDNSGYYFLLQTKAIDYCLRNNFKILYNGQAKYIPKLSLGHSLYPLYCSVKTNSKLLQYIIKLMLRNISWSDMSPDLAEYLKAHPDALPTL